MTQDLTKRLTSIEGMNQPTTAELISAVATHFQANEAVALSWLTTFARNFDPRVAANELAERQATAGLLSGR